MAIGGKRFSSFPPIEGGLWRSVAPMAKKLLFILGERLFSGNEALPAKEKSLLDFVKSFFLWSVAPPARGAGGIPTSPLCPPGPPIPPSNGRGIPPDPPCTGRDTSSCLSADRVRIGHAIWFGLGPATNRVPQWARTLHGTLVAARIAARYYCRNGPLPSLQG